MLNFVIREEKPTIKYWFFKWKWAQKGKFKTTDVNH